MNKKVQQFLEAVGEGNIDSVVSFLSRGGNVNAREENGRTAIHWAANNGRDTLIETLLSYGSDIAAVDKYGQQAIHLAAAEGHVSVVKELVSFGCDSIARDNDGCQAIHYAASYDKKKVIKALLNLANVHVDEKTSDHRTPLMLAVETSSFSSVVYLIWRRADVNVVDSAGRTALHHAFITWNACATNGDKCKYEAKLSKCKVIKERVIFQSEKAGLKCAHAAVIQFLIERGNANLTIKDEDGKTPMDYIPDQFAEKRNYFDSLPSSQTNYEKLLDRCVKAEKELKFLREKLGFLP